MLRSLLVATVSCAWLAEGQTQTTFYAPHTGPVAEVQITLTSAPSSHSIELRNAGAKTAPILHLLDSNRRQLASAIGKTAANALSIDGKTAGTFTVIVRAAPEKTPSIQTAELWVDGKLHTKSLRYSSGTAFAMSRLSPAERIIGVSAPQGPASHVAYLLSPDGLRILARSSGSQTTLTPPAQGDAVVLLATRGGELSGPLRVYRNDLAWDTDGDGLSDALENALGTCASNVGSVAGVNCNEIADPRDTDGDGLPDGWEVLGKLSGWYEHGVFRTEYLNLPAWGADPRHKDIFLEVDFRRLNLEENQSGLALKMPPAVARQMAASYGDGATTDPILKLVHGVSVNNPDRLPGIHLHIDSGVAPVDPADATIYGDWGGYNPVDAVQDADGNWVPQRPEQVWQQQMSRARWGVFHYVMGYATGGGSCGVGIACGFNFNDGGNAAHEFGHTLGLNHNGPNGIHEPNCKPNYPSLMNYAYLGQGFHQFADGLNYPLLNNHSLLETNAVDPANTPLLNVLENAFQYRVDRATGSVDWNRDGVYAPAGSTVRAYANYQPWNSCEFTREGMKDSGLQSESSPAVVYFQNKILVFAVGLDGLVRFTFTQDPWICSPSVDNCPDPMFEPPIILPIGQMLSVDAKPYRVNPNLEQIIVTGIRADGSLIEIPVILDSGGWPAWGTVTTISGPSTAAGELTLAVSQAKTALAMVYKAPDNTVRYRNRTSGGWSAELALKAGGQPIQVHPDTSPGLVFTDLPIGIFQHENLVGAFTDPSGYIQLYSPALFGGGWNRISIPYQPMYSPAGRPVMAWVGSPSVLTNASSLALAPPPATANRFYILFLEYQTSPIATPTNAVRMAMSYVDTAGTLRIGLGAYFDNVWSYAYGTGLVQPSVAGLRAVVTSAVPNSLRNVFFRPHADGISDLPYRNYDDWKTIGWGSCATVAPAQTTMNIQCAPPW